MITFVLFCSFFINNISGTVGNVEFPCLYWESVTHIMKLRLSSGPLPLTLPRHLGLCTAAGQLNSLKDVDRMVEEILVKNLTL